MAKAAAGDFGFKVLTSSDAAEKTKELPAVLANGSLVMVAIIGMFIQDGLTDSAWGAGALYAASPLRAFDTELGDQAPVGFCDPAGFTADGNYETFHQPLPDGADIMAIIGMFLQDGLTGSAYGAGALHTASPLHAFDNELGVQVPGVSVILLASRLMEATRISPAAARRSGRHGSPRLVPPGGSHWLCLWRLCLVPGISAARVR